MPRAVKNPDPVQAHIENIAEMAKDAFREHHVKRQLDNGLWRSWRCKRHGSWCYGFDVLTMPGYLVITGDLGEIIFCRELDMLEWARKSQKDLHYMAGKVEAIQGGSTREYDAQVARKWLDDEIREAQNEIDSQMDSRGHYKERRDKLIELRAWGADDGPELFSARLYESGVNDGNDWPDLKNWSSTYLWLVEALRWFLKNLRQPRKRVARSFPDIITGRGRIQARRDK